MAESEKSSVWFAVINGYAASRKAGSLWEKAESLLRARNITFHGTMTGRAGNASELTFDACMAGYRRFIAVGGDGTVHDVLNGVAGFMDWCQSSGKNLSFSDFTLGVIPLGSGNDWVRSLGMKHNLIKAIDVIEKGKTMKQDVVKVTVLDPSDSVHERELSVSYMVNVGGVGLDARVCQRVNRMKRKGKAGKILYVTSLIRVLSSRVPTVAKICCDGNEVFSSKFLSIAFGIGKYSGGGMRQTPDAVLGDGLLDMTIIPDVPLRRIAFEAYRLFTGSFLKIPEVMAFKAKVITVLPDNEEHAEPVEVDGEVVGKSPVRFEVLSDQINILSV